MKFPGSIGVMIIIISFFGAAFISAIEITPIYKENTYEPKAENLLKDQSEVKLSEYQDYVIPKTYETQPIPYNKDHSIFIYTEIAPLKTILNSLNYSDNCESITVELNQKTEQWTKWKISYPVTPFLCKVDKTKWLAPFDNSDIFSYKPGESVIYLKDSENGLSIDDLYVAHNHNAVGYYAKIMTDMTNIDDDRDYIVKWCEKVKNNVISNPIIDIEETYPDLRYDLYNGKIYCKVNLSNFTKYGDKLTINGIFHNIVNNQIVIGEPYDLKNIDILYENKNCILKLNDIDKTIDLGSICNYKIIGSGDWEFESKFYECNHINEITGYEWNTNPSALFNINSSFIIVFIGTVLILSGLCSFSIGLNFIDLAVIISIIAFILVM